MKASRAKALTEPAIREKARLAGERSMRAGDRRMWSDKDASVAIAEYERLKAAQEGLTTKG